MSGIAGILRLDGGPVDPAAVAAMSAAIAHRGPDGSGQHVIGPVGLAHVRNITVGGGRDDVAQPWPDVAERTWLTLDGRIDNRDEVLAALGPDRDRLRNGSDAELVLQAYLTWGRAGIVRLVGDFAFAIWDAGRHELVCGRDALGKRPLLYLRDRTGGGDALRWASEIGAVLADPGIPRKPNPGMIAEHLVGAVTSTTDTVFADVVRLPPAHLLVARADGAVSVERYWSWDPTLGAPPTRTEAEARAHVEEFLHLFTRVVGDHLAASEPVAAELSGGVDSSSVVGVASHLLRGDGRRALELFSLVFPGRPADESPYIHEVARHAGLVAHEFAPGPLGQVFYDDEQRRTLLPAGPPNLSMHHAHLVDARRRGCRVVLTGQGGDEWFSGSPYAYADDLRRLRLRGLRGRAREARMVFPNHSAAHQLVRDGLLPLTRRPHHARPTVDFLPAAFRASVALDDRLRRPALRGTWKASAHLATSLDHGGAVHASERAEQAFLAAGLERRSPFDDRRLIELALGLPDDVRRRGVTTKWVVREAMDGFVPDAVRSRLDKARFGFLVPEEMEAHGGISIFDDLALADLGWVDGQRLQRDYADMVRAAREGKGHPATWALWTVHCTDRWIRSILSP